MTEVISVKFKSRGKTYFFAPNGIDVPDGVQVVVETAKGLELADCVKGNHYVTDESIVPPLRPVVRTATADDLRIAEICKAREKEAFGICEQKIAQHKLEMKLVDVECNFEGNKILFFFTSDGRVDFRELVKDLAGIFRTRIELRQIGVRDEAKMLGGLGICGRPFCCNQFLDDFQPVSTKMAKVQSLSLNPTKISGVCGRLMCCLRYEQEAYEDLVKSVPKNGAFVETPSGYGNVAQVNLLRRKVKVKLDGDETTLKSFDADEVAAIPGGRPRPGEPLPHILELKEKPPKEEPVEDLWEAPSMFGELRGYSGAVSESAPHGEADTASHEEEKKKHRRPRRKKSAGEHPTQAEGAQRRENGGEKHPAEQKNAENGQKTAKQTAQQKSPRQESAHERPAGEEQRAQHAPASGAANSGDKKRRPRRKKSAGERPTQAEGGEKRPTEPKSSENGQRSAKPNASPKPPRQSPRPPKPEGEAGGSPAAGEGQRKKNNYRRRWHGHSKPKSGGEGKSGAPSGNS